MSKQTVTVTVKITMEGHEDNSPDLDIQGEAFAEAILDAFDGSEIWVEKDDPDGDQDLFEVTDVEVLTAERTFEEIHSLA